jgi:hypothetical protein
MGLALGLYSPTVNNSFVGDRTSNLGRFTPTVSKALAQLVLAGNKTEFDVL